MSSPASASSILAELVAAARRHRASGRHTTVLTVRYIAARTRELLPAAASAGLGWSDDGRWLELTGFYAADGTQITGGGEALGARLRKLEEDLAPYPTANLNNENRSTWRPFTADTADGEYRLIIGKVLAACDHGRPCGCEQPEPVTVSGVVMPGHEPDCPAGSPRTYAWTADDRLVTGTLADYARSWAASRDESLPGSEVSSEIRTWDAAYPVRTEALTATPDDDGCWIIRLSVPGERATVRVWALTCPALDAAPPLRAAQAAWPVPDPGPSYEGYVVYADGTRMCLHCYDGDHARCPDVLPPEEEHADGPLDGYNCCCDCSHGTGPAAKRAVTTRFFDARVERVPADEAAPCSDTYLLEAFGVGVLVRQRRTGSYVRVDTVQTAEPPLMPLEVEVSNSGESTYSGQSLYT